MLSDFRHLKCGFISEQRLLSMGFSNLDLHLYQQGLKLSSLVRRAIIFVIQHYTQRVCGGHGGSDGACLSSAVRGVKP